MFIINPIVTLTQIHTEYYKLLTCELMKKDIFLNHMKSTFTSFCHRFKNAQSFKYGFLCDVTVIYVTVVYANM